MDEKITMEQTKKSESEVEFFNVFFPKNEIFVRFIIRRMNIIHNNTANIPNN